MPSTRNELITIALHRTTSALDRETQRALRAFGLTLGQFAVLEALAHKGPMAVGDIKRAVLSTDGTIPVVLKNLQAQGFIGSKPDPADGRRRIVWITEAGREVFEPAYKASRQVLDQVLSAWSPEERVQLSHLLSKAPEPQEERTREHTPQEQTRRITRGLQPPHSGKTRNSTM